MPYEWFESLNWMRTHTPDPQGSPDTAELRLLERHIYEASERGRV